MKSLDYAIVKHIFELISGKLNRAVHQMQKILFSIDSTTSTVGKTRLSWKTLWN